MRLASGAVALALLASALLGATTLPTGAASAPSSPLAPPPERASPSLARLPSRASEPLALRDPAGHVSLGISLEGARHAVARWLDDGAHYDEALGPGTELRLHPRPDGFEDVISFASAPPGERVSYSLDLRSVAGLRLLHRSLELLDPRGAPRLRMEPPYLIDADGRRVDAEVALGCAHDASPRPPWGRPVVAPGAEECRLTVSWAGRDVRYPAVLDPVWTTTQQPATQRQEGSGGQLPDGRVLVAGGSRCVNTICLPVLNAEVYDPATDTWAAAGSLPFKMRLAATAEVPGRGVGLFGDVEDAAHAALYEASSGTWLKLPDMPHGHGYSVVVPQPDGSAVTVIGGTNALKATVTAIDTLDLSSLAWSSPAVLKQARAFHAAARLPDGRILVAAGTSSISIVKPLSSVEIYDPATAEVTSGAPLGGSNYLLALRPLEVNGKPSLLAFGGSANKTELFDVGTGTWSPVAPLLQSRAYFVSTRLDDGTLLAVGGVNIVGGVHLNSAERFDPTTLTWLPLHPMTTKRVLAAGGRLGDGRVLVAGGTTNLFDDATDSSPSAEVLRLLGPGEACTLAADCRSFHCVDGVCCDQACDQLCQGCAAAKTGGADGVCQNFAQGSDPDDECDVQEPTTCGSTGVCNGQGQCARYPVNTLCGAATCSGGVSSKQLCDGGGICLPLPVDCAPYLCQDPTACATACESDEQCVPAAHCAQKACVTDLPMGAACPRDAACQSGFCVDGVCCDSACQAPCQACSAALKAEGPDGLCGNAKAGLDPHDSCDEDPALSCDRDGTCDGKGGCAVYPSGTPCQSGACGGTPAAARSDSFACDGAGACVSQSQECGLYGCFLGSCRTSCQVDSDCAPSAYCQQGACVARKPTQAGQTCQADHECLDGFCVDGFCCNTTCRGPCEACDVPSAPGSCVAVVGDPHPKHPACTEAPEGQPCQQRHCDGKVRASCAGFVGTEVVCRAPSCADGQATLPGLCDGQGNCPPVLTATCGIFACKGDQCATSCTSDADCSPNFRCDPTSPAGCVQRTVAECDGDHTLTNPDGSTTNCAPYRCAESACLGRCTSVLDCVLPSVCDEDSHACVLPPPNLTGQSGGCHLSAGPSPRAWPAALALLGALLLRRRRARALVGAALALLPGCSGQDDPAPPAPAPSPAPTLASLPAEAPGPVALRLPAFAFAFRLDHARPVAASPADRGVDFPGALGPGTTMRLRHLAHGVEDVISFASAPPGERVSYSLDLRSVAGLRLLHRSLELLDPHGAPRLRMEPPYLIDADGRRVDAEVALGCAHDASPRPPWGRPVVAPGAEECRLTVSWAGHGVRYPAVLDPAWTTTQSLSRGRRAAVSGLLADGRLLVGGGLDCQAGACTGDAGTEVYDPATDTWAMGATMKEANYQAVTVRTPGLGLVVLGGGPLGGETLGTTKAEYYDEAKAAWVSLPPMKNGRVFPTAAVLGGGTRVAVFGGTQDLGFKTLFSEVEILDTVTRTWSTGGSLSKPRVLHTSTTLPDGKVLVAGGVTCAACPLGNDTAELYDPETKSSAQLDPMPTARAIHQAALIERQGKTLLLLTGGISPQSDLFDPQTQGWMAGPMAGAARAYGQLIKLADGTLLDTGGTFPPAKSLDTTERFDPEALVWKPAGKLTTGQSLAVAALLPDGRALVGGGMADFTTGTTTTVVDVFRLRAQGDTCGEDGECASLHCVDGVCCASACDGTCQGCLAIHTGGPDGVCGPVQVGQDPHDQCSQEVPGTCGRTGVCDGQGQCARYPVDTPCGAVVCFQGLLNEPRCDQQGQCATQETACFPYVCRDQVACGSICTEDTQCALGAHCAGGACVNDLPQGAPCTRSAMCQSGSCADGVCCDGACEGLCEACSAALKQTGADGVCGPVRQGTDPHDSCGETPPETCDQNGLCDGEGHCSMHLAGTKCQESACVGGGEPRLESYACDGAGACVAASVSCQAYACVGTSCQTSCASDADCAPGARCTQAKCVARGKSGEACASALECESGFCADGVCCNKACDAPCEACAEQGAKGSCIPVSGPPRQGHPACAAAPAGQPCQQRTCDGETPLSCAGYVGDEVVCQKPSCTQGVAQPGGACDAKGACAELAAIPCGAYVCQGDQCATSCASDADCAAQFRCDKGTKGGACVARVGAFCRSSHVLVTAEGVEQECAPYACEGSACKTECSSVLDCALPSVCDGTSRKCVAPPENPRSDGGCQLVVAAAPSSPAALIGLALAAWLGRRRARRGAPA